MKLIKTQKNNKIILYQNDKLFISLNILLEKEKGKYTGIYNLLKKQK